LTKDAEGDIGLQIELSAAYMRLGEVQLSIGTANLGDRAGANASYQKAETLLHSVLASDRFNVTARRNLAACYEHDASLYELRTAQAQGAAGEALKISQELVQERPNDETLQKDLARALHVMAIQAPGSTERVSYHTQELEIYEKLLALHPESFELQRDTALAQKYIASEQLDAGLGQPAIAHLRAALALDSKRAEANPNNAQAQLDASFDMSEIGYYYMDQKKLDAALQNFQQALQVRRKLLQLDPENHELQGRVAYITTMVADVLLKMGKNDEALNYYRSLADLATALVAKDAGDADNRGYLGFAYNGIATAQERLASGARGEKKQEYGRQACAFYRKSYEVFRPIADLPGMQGPEKQTIKDVTDAVARCSR
jgi:tetratricopeptide (TPR) repeat protein